QIERAFDDTDCLRILRRICNKSALCIIEISCCVNTEGIKVLEAHASCFAELWGKPVGTSQSEEIKGDRAFNGISHKGEDQIGLVDFDPGFSQVMKPRVAPKVKSSAR